MFTDNQLQILAVLISHPQKEYYLSELGAIIQKHPGVFQRGINSLEEQGIIASRRRGNQRLFKINKDNPIFNEIKNIVNKLQGVEGLLLNLVKDEKRISVALIYGSYAKHKVRIDSDIDVLIVANDLEVEDVILDKIENIERKIQREINYKIYSKKEFLEKIEKKDAFIEEVLSDKYILLKGKI